MQILSTVDPANTSIHGPTPDSMCTLRWNQLIVPTASTSSAPLQRLLTPFFLKVSSMLEDSKGLYILTSTIICVGRVPMTIQSSQIY